MQATNSICIGLSLVLLTIAAAAQVPFLNQALNPASIAPGSKAFTLTVIGTGFKTSAFVNWDGSKRATTYISSSQLQASIKATDVASAKTAWITVTNPAPGGGTSNVIFFPVTTERSTLSFADTTSFEADSVVVGDFNNDKKLDVVASSESATNLYLGNGRGGFESPIQVTLGSFTQMVAGDFNGDGNLDIAGFWGENLYVYLGNGDGTFTQSFSLSTEPLEITAMATADFNGDGKLDLYISGWETGPNYVQIYNGNGDGTFTLGGSYYTGTAPTGYIPGIPAIGDFTGNGYLGLVIGGESEDGVFTVSVWTGSADGGLTQTGTVSGATGFNFAAADLTNNGKLDVVTDTGCVLLGNGNGTFSSCSYLSSTGVIDGIGDFNGDAILDLANNQVAILLGAGNGTFPTVFTLGGGGGHPPGAIGDFNNDGLLDVVSSTGYVFLQKTVVLAPADLFFGDQSVGAKSAPQTATLTNIADSALTIDKISITGKNSSQFAQSNNCGTSLAAGDSCTISVTFAPTKSGSFTAELSVTYKGAASPQTAYLSGTGT